MNRAHFSLKLRKDRPRKDGSFGIYLYANINGKLSWYSTNKSIKVKYWNERNQEVKSSGPEWISINSHISIFLATAKGYITQCNLDGNIANNQTLDGMLRAVKFKTNSYFNFVEQYINKYSRNYAPNTLKGFRSHLSKLRGFKSKVEFDDINILFWKGFENHLKSLGNKQNTVHKQYKLLKKFVNQAIEFGVVRENLLKGLKVKSHPGNMQYLTMDEVVKLQSLYDNPEVIKANKKQVLRYFLFACYTGLRYSDIKKLQNKNILSGESVNVLQDKTGKLVDIPLSGKAKSLIVNHSVPNANVFRVFTNQVTNRYLKQIMTLANIEKKISFHCARHTWATNTLEMTGNIALVSDILGHSSIKTTQIYAKVLGKKKEEAMKMWDRF